MKCKCCGRRVIMPGDTFVATHNVQLVYRIDSVPDSMLDKVIYRDVEGVMRKIDLCQFVDWINKGQVILTEE